jgi:hypothetical protein
MSKPLPPIVYGALTPASKAVLVGGFLPGATVEIFSNGVPVGNSQPNGQGWVALTAALIHGHVVTATQTLGGQTSAQSINPIPVVAVPSPLPAPLFASPLSDAMDVLEMSGLFSGAQLELTSPPGGSVIASVPVSQTSAYVFLNLSVPLTAGDRIQAVQSIGSNKSIPVQSMPMFELSYPRDRRLPTPQVLPPLEGCQTSINFASAVLTADMHVTTGSSNYEWLNEFPNYTGSGAAPLQAGSLLTATQTVKRLKLTSAAYSTKVQPTSPPVAPLIVSTVCPTVNMLTAANLVPGGILHVSVRVYPSHAAVGGSIYTETEIGEAGIQQTSQDFFIPAGALPSAPTDRMALVVAQELCTKTSPYSNIATFPPNAPHGPPSITTPLRDCARLIQVTGAQTGATVQAFVTGAANSNPVSVPAGGTVIVPLWLPLITGQHVYVEQKGCNADGHSAVELVLGLPSPIPTPLVQSPIRPGATQVEVTDCVPGAYVYVFVGTQFFGKLGVTSTVAVPVPPLVSGELITCAETVCEGNIAGERKPVTVTVGNMSVSAFPDPVERGTHVTETVTVKDATSGSPVVSATVSLKGIVVGYTGANGEVSFAFSPTPGEADPSGVVTDAPGYNPATYMIALVNPPSTGSTGHMHRAPPHHGWFSPPPDFPRHEELPPPSGGEGEALRLLEAVQRALGSLSRPSSPTLGITAVMGMAVLGIVGVVALVEGKGDESKRR